MKREDADSVVRALQESRTFSGEKIAASLDSQGLLDDKDSLGMVMQSMAAKGNTFMAFVKDWLLETATSSTFLELVSELARKNLWPISDLVDLYKKNPKVAMNVYNELARRADARLATAMGFLLGGINTVEPTKLVKLISSTKDVPLHEKTAFVVSLRFFPRESTMPSEVAKFVVTCSESDNPQLRWEAIITMMTTFGSSARFGKAIMKLARQDDKAKGTIASAAMMISKKNSRYVLELLEVCAASANPSVLSEVAQTLASIAPSYPLESLKIVRSWTTRELRHKIPLDWLLQQIGEGDETITSKFLVDWLRSEKDELTLMFDLPRCASGIFSKHFEASMSLTKLLNMKSKKEEEFALNLLELTLSGLYSQIDRDKQFANACSRILTEIANQRGVNPKEVTNSIGDPVMACLALVNACKYPGRKSNGKLVKENLKSFPNLVKAFGPSWFNAQLGKATSHPLIPILSGAKVSGKLIKSLSTQLNRARDPAVRALIANGIQGQYYAFAFLADLDWALSMFNRTEQGMPGIIERLKNSDEFYQTLSEIQLAARIKRKYPVVLQYKVGGRPVDIKATVEGTELLIEVFGGDTGLVLKYIRTVVGIGNRAKKKAVEKIDGQLKHVAAKTSLPIVLAIDRSRSYDIDELDVEAALEGSQGIRFLFNTQTGEAIEAYPVRNKDAISDENADAKNLSGILVMKKDMDAKAPKVKLFGRLYMNPQTVRPIAPKILEALQDVVFG